MSTTRTLSPGSQIATIYATDLRRLVRARKTLVLFAVQLLPVVFALIYVFFQNIDGLSMFSETVDGVIFPFLIPLAAVFYGGPALVDEMEGRTLTYLTLRPVPKPALFLGKWLAGTTVAVGLVLIPVLALLGIVALASGGSLGTSFGTIAQIVVACAVGTACYTAIFAALGALVAKSLFAGILYFVVFELIFAALPLVELVSVRYHMRNAAGFAAQNQLGALSGFMFDEPLILDWWVGALAVAMMCSLAVVAGATIFTKKQYHI